MPLGDIVERLRDVIVGAGNDFNCGSNDAMLFRLSDR